MSATLDYGAALDNTMGAMLIGVIVSGVLHGICLVQAFFYFMSQPKDPLLIKAMVRTFFAGIRCAYSRYVVYVAVSKRWLSSLLVYHYLVTNFGKEDALQQLVWSVLMEALLTGLNGAMVQTYDYRYYTYRVWQLSKKNYFLAGLILLLILATAVWVILSMRFETYRELLTINPLTITINALSCAVDVLIAASLCWMLHNSRTGFKRSDNIINKLMIFVVNTGMLTTSCAIASLVALVVSPNTLIYATFYFCIGRFYTNSFIATLNARKGLSGSNQNTQQDSGNMMMSASRSALSSNGKKTPHDIAIRIETTQEALNDRNERKTPLVRSHPSPPYFIR
ncbi:hypothetical protein EST38_g2293 [Candolleomyces aberdarensis]|uniref:DUF6534 domain-containing protein n=1 Tax=Candolleomyces aberdarensis TaxID=2316362 RepID=A0A4V1Q4X1_9AGAR|nr:hypothetical protein EST38_g2293 [Candolleomyces aberdarensis]